MKAINGYAIKPHADLRSANLRSANLTDANLTDANLHCANLRNANLAYANLHCVNLRNADLTHADLTHANLHCANLRNANLAYANLTDANLRNANLTHADLTHADLRGALLPHFQICPAYGEFYAYKKAQKHVLRLRIPEDAKRTSSLIGRKCRASYAVVDAVLINGKWEVSCTEQFISGRKGIYVVGSEYHPDGYDDDIRVECTHGVHFFMTQKEAEEW